MARKLLNMYGNNRKTSGSVGVLPVCLPEFAKVFLASLLRAVALGLILAITILPVSLVAQAIADVEIGGRELPESPMARAQRDGNALPLTLTEATKRALENNLFENVDSAVIAQVQQRYWALVLAIRQYEIRRNLVNMARMNLLDNRRVLQAGSIDISFLQAEAFVAGQEASLVIFENSILQAQNDLCQTMSGGSNSEIREKFIVPTDLPDFVEYKIDLDMAIVTALRNRSGIDTEQNIVSDVTNAARMLESIRVALTRDTRSVGQKHYEDEQKRDDAGLTKNNVLLDALKAVGNAELLELQLLINYKQAIVNLERALSRTARYKL